MMLAEQPHGASVLPFWRTPYCYEFRFAFSSEYFAIYFIRPW